MCDTRHMYLYIFGKICETIYRKDLFISYNMCEPTWKKLEVVGPLSVHEGAPPTHDEEKRLESHNGETQWHGTLLDKGY